MAFTELAFSTTCPPRSVNFRSNTAHILLLISPPRYRRTTWPLNGPCCFFLRGFACSCWGLFRFCWGLLARDRNSFCIEICFCFARIRFALCFMDDNEKRAAEALVVEAAEEAAETEAGAGTKAEEVFSSSSSDEEHRNCMMSPLMLHVHLPHSFQQWQWER